MTSWAFANPVSIHFGEGAITECAALLAKRNYGLVTHPDAAMQPWIDTLVAQCGTPTLVIKDIEPNPTVASLEHISQQYLTSKTFPDVLIALGGGSVIDSTKFLAAGRGHFEPLLQSIRSGSRMPGHALPFIAIPTTAGTGSDLTKWATVWDSESGTKYSLEREDIYAEAAIVDPLIMASLPWAVTLASGLDALSHSLESIWNHSVNPISRDLAISAAIGIMQALPRLRREPHDRDARKCLALGALRAGLAFSNTRTALAHNISYPITLAHNVPHGIACSFCLPEVLTAALGADPACDDALQTIFGGLREAPARLRAFLNELGVAAGYEDLAIPASKWRRYVEAGFSGPRGRNFIGRIEDFPFDTSLADVDTAAE